MRVHRSVSEGLDHSRQFPPSRHAELDVGTLQQVVDRAHRQVQPFTDLSAGEPGGRQRATSRRGLSTAIGTSSKGGVAASGQRTRCASAMRSPRVSSPCPSGVRPRWRHGPRLPPRATRWAYAAYSPAASTNSRGSSATKARAWRAWVAYNPPWTPPGDGIEMRADVRRLAQPARQVVPHAGGQTPLLTFLGAGSSVPQRFTRPSSNRPDGTRRPAHGRGLRRCRGR